MFEYEVIVKGEDKTRFLFGYNREDAVKRVGLKMEDVEYWLCADYID